MWLPDRKDCHLNQITPALRYLLIAPELSSHLG